MPNKSNRYQPYALRKKALTFYVTILFGLKVSVGFLIFAFPQTAYYASANIEEIARLTNEARASVSLTPLTINSKLNQSALAKANDMIDNQYFAHVSPEGVDPWFWFDQAGYSYTYAGENLAVGFETSEGVHEAWMNSPGHRDNIINPNFKEIGIGIVYGTFEGYYTTMIVQHFGSTENTAPEDIPVYLPEEEEDETTPEEPEEEEEEEEPPAPKPEPPAPDTTPPAPPKIYTPKNNSITKNTQVTISGQAEADSSVFIYQAQVKIGETKANKNNGFSFTLASYLSDGTHTFRVIAKDSSENWSAFSETVRITIDAEAPKINLEKSYAIPTYLNPQEKFDVFAYVTGDPEEVKALSDGYETVLQTKGDNLWEGVIKQTEGGIWIKAKDQAGNVASQQLTSVRKLEVTPPLAKNRTINKNNHWALFIDTLDRSMTNLIILFVGAIVILLIINIIIHITKQNPHLIASTIFVLILSGLILYL